MDTLTSEQFRELTSKGIISVGKKGRLKMLDTIPEFQKQVVDPILNNYVKINIKPLSVNEAWQGKKFKTDKYKNYEKLLLSLLPDIVIPKPPFKISYEFGMSKNSDIDNPTKNFQDILAKRYEFNDRYIMEISIKKKVVKKGNEFIEFKIETIKET